MIHMTKYTIKVASYGDQTINVYTGGLHITLLNKHLIPVQIRERLAPFIREAQHRVVERDLESFTINVSTKNLKRVA